MRMARPFWFDVSFSDGLGNQLPDHHQGLPDLALRWAGLLTQVMVPNNVNTASHTSPRLSPSPNDHHL